jgi:hypothetical protein
MRFVPRSFRGRCRAGILLLPTVGLCALTPAHSQQSASHVSRRAGATGMKSAAPVGRAGICRNFARIPAAFERNRGQADSHVQFLVHQSHSTLFLTPTEAVFALDTPHNGRVSSTGRSHPSSADLHGGLTSVLRMQLVNANGKAEAVGEQALGSNVNYFIGRDPSRWQTGVSSYAKARYRSVYQGVDVVYYGNREHLEYDFVVAPHARPEQIALRFVGAEKVRIDSAGDLKVKLPGQTLTWQTPTVYQEGRTGRRKVACRYVLSRGVEGKPVLRFALGRYDTSRSLVIDPALIYSTFLGGSVGDAGNSIAVDSSGSAYITGYTSSTDFPTSSQAYQKTKRSVSRSNAFVTRLSADGATILYSTYLGGTGYESGNGIAIDSSGNAYITGESDSTDFPTTSGAYQTTNLSGATTFVTKLSATGAALIYSTYLGGTSSEAGNGIAVDSSGNAYVVGFTSSTDFPVTSGAFQKTNKSANSTNAFVTKLNATGTGLTYSTYIGGSGYEVGNGIAVDSAGNAYITGYTASTDFPTTSGAYQSSTHSNGRTSTFVTKLSTTGAALTYSTYMGGSAYGSGNGIAVDSSGSAYVTGYTASADFPITSGAYQTTNTSAAGSSAFVTKLNAAGTSLVCSTFLGGTSYEAGGSIAIDSTGNVFVTGSTVSTDFPTTAGASQTTKRSISPSLYGFFTKLNPTCSALLYSTYLGGSTGDKGNGIAVDSTGYAYITGSSGSADFPVTTGVVQGTNKGGNGGNGFVAKLNPNVSIPRAAVDFNNDGKADLLLQNPSTGQMSVWFMNAFNFLGSASFSQNPGVNYSLIGKGDFTGAGIATLVLQSQTNNSVVYWYAQGVNNATITGGDNVIPSPQAGWKVVGIGDFNGDGKSDLVFQSTTTNQVAIWFMNGPYYQGGVLMPYTPPVGWLVVGVGDFDGDGNPDLAFQNQDTGQIVIWFMSGATYTGGSAITTTVASGWKVVGVADYNGDGKADLLLQNQTTGQGSIWFMNGTTYLGGSILSALPSAGWRIAGPK